MASSTRTDEATAATTATATTAVETTEQAGRGHGAAPISASAASIDGVRFGCLMNARYHSAREAFLDSLHRWIMFFIILFGAGAVLDLLPEGFPWTATLAASAAALAALDLTFDLSNRARIHALMKRRYFELLSDMTEGTKTAVQAEACLHRYSADEEPAYHALMASSWNSAQEMMYGDDGDAYVIPFFDRKLQNFWRREGKKYPIKARRLLET